VPGTPRDVAIAISQVQCIHGLAVQAGDELKAKETEISADL